eukprot:1387060-Amphidinium_carterae.1
MDETIVRDANDFMTHLGVRTEVDSLWVPYVEGSIARLRVSTKNQAWKIIRAVGKAQHSFATGKKAWCNFQETRKALPRSRLNGPMPLIHAAAAADDSADAQPQMEFQTMVCLASGKLYVCGVASPDWASMSQTSRAGSSDYLVPHVSAPPKSCQGGCGCETTLMHGQRMLGRHMALSSAPSGLPTWCPAYRPTPCSASQCSGQICTLRRELRKQLARPEEYSSAQRSETKHALWRTLRARAQDPLTDNITVAASITDYRMRARKLHAHRPLELEGGELG